MLRFVATPLLVASLLWLASPVRAQTEADYILQLDVVSEGFDKKTCWVHPRAGILPAGTPGAPDDRPAVVLTMNKLELTGSDVFHAINSLHTEDLGATWTRPIPHETMGRVRVDDHTEHSICDVVPGWHAASGKLLAIGQTVWYRDNKVMKVRPRHVAYSVYDPVARTWSPRTNMELPDEPRFKHGGAGSAQRVDLENGDILLPIYYKVAEADRHQVTVVRAGFDGETLRYIEHGDELSAEGVRGLYEPSLTRFGGRFYLTLRSDEAGWVTSGTDGLHYDPPRKWTFDDGSDLGNYNTQQHWVTHTGGLYLVYTRRGANNDHVFRHRAPLFMAKVDPERLCVIRSTEQILVPDKGARLGNFGVVDVSPHETWVTTAEWMQTKEPDPFDWRVPMKYGSNNRVYVARIKWHKPNELVK
jgi:hypothetical protein